VHCEPLGKLADFFGRNMIAHRHDRVFQVHLLTRGEVRLHLDEQFYHARAPLFFLTPPSVTHAFIISDDADGYVLEARQQLIWRLFKSDPSGLLEQRLAIRPASNWSRPATTMAVMAMPGNGVNCCIISTCSAPSLPPRTLAAN